MDHRALCLCLIVATLVGGNVVQAGDWMWAKGNMHTHTTNSDGDGSPQAVADWYRDHGYQFLVITDHGVVTDPAPLDNDPSDKYILIPGAEVAVPDQGDKPVHGVAINVRQTIPAPKGCATQGRTLRSMVDDIGKAGAIPMVCHPNWCWAFTHRELLHVRGPYLLEIANMSSGCNNEGSLSRPSTEQIWDILLSEGREVYATATDDMHALGIGPKVDGPCRGWVVARVPELTQQAVLKALSAGDFYASTGVELADYSFDGKEFRVSVVPRADTNYLIRFAGKWGSILQETVGTTASFRPAEKPDRNSYVRCKVISSDGTVAWTQAYRIKG